MICKLENPLSILNEKPDTTVPKSVSIRAVLRYTKLLRIEGNVEGKIVPYLENPSDSCSLILCSTGQIRGNLKGLKVAYIDGEVLGSIRASHVILGPNASVMGHIECNFIDICSGSRIFGKLNINSSIDMSQNVIVS